MTASRDKYFKNGRGADLRRASSHNRTRKKTWVVEEMWEVHHEVKRLLVLGMSNVKIAEHTGLTQVQVSSIKNSPVVMEQVAIMRGARDAGTVDLSKQIAELAPKALENLKTAVETGKILDKEMSASEILRESNNVIDRTIGKPTQTIIGKHAVAHLTLEDIDKVKARAKKMAESNGILQEALG